MDEKKRKWEKPILEDISGTLTYGDEVCTKGYDVRQTWCHSGGVPAYGCSSGTSPYSFDCTVGGAVTICHTGNGVACSVGSGVEG